MSGLGRKTAFVFGVRRDIEMCTAREMTFIFSFVAYENPRGGQGIRESY
jgi:hypothetical protein